MVLASLFVNYILHVHDCILQREQPLLSNFQFVTTITKNSVENDRKHFLAMNYIYLDLVRKKLLKKNQITLCFQ